MENKIFKIQIDELSTNTYSIYHKTKNITQKSWKENPIPSNYILINLGNKPNTIKFNEETEVKVPIINNQFYSKRFINLFGSIKCLTHSSAEKGVAPGETLKN